MGMLLFAATLASIRRSSRRVGYAIATLACTEFPQTLAIALSCTLPPLRSPRFRLSPSIFVEWVYRRRPEASVDAAVLTSFSREWFRYVVACVDRILNDVRRSWLRIRLQFVVFCCVLCEVCFGGKISWNGHFLCVLGFNEFLWCRMSSKGSISVLCWYFIEILFWVSFVVFVLEDSREVHWVELDWG